MTEFLKNALTIYLTENPKDAERFVNCVLVNRRSREAAENAGQIAKKKLSTVVDSANRVEKFVNCRSKDQTKNILNPPNNHPQGQVRYLVSRFPPCLSSNGHQLQRQIC